MIAVLDSDGKGRGFVGILHRQGFTVSWVVELGADVGFDALPSAFCGAVHPVGFDDEPMLRTAVSGCEVVVVLGSIGGKSAERSVLMELDVPVFEAGGAGSTYEIKPLELEPMTSVPKAAVATLIQHVG